MARYFAGNTLAAFFRTNLDCVESTSSGTFDSGFVSNSILVTGPAGAGDFIRTYAFSATGTVWTHFEYYTTATTGTDQIALWRNGSTGVFRLKPSNMSTVQPQYWNGSAWVNTGSPIDMTGTRRRVDIKIDLGSGFELYYAGTKISEGSGWSGGGTTITDVAWCYPDVSFDNRSFYVSQVLVADFDTRDSRYHQATMDGNSATDTGGTGTYTDVSETVLNESTAEYVTVSGNRMGQTYANITVPSGYVIGGACMAARGRISGAITDGKLGFLSSASRSTSTGRTYTTGYEPRGYIIETDPATSSAFTQSGFNALETFFEAV